MRNRAAVLSVLLIVLAIVALVPAAVAQMPQPFSADMSVTPGNKGSEPMNGKVYFGGQKFRMDMSSRGHDMEIISDLQNKISYMIMPQQRMYMEMSLNNMMMSRGQRPDFKPYDASNPCANEEGTTCKKIGTESVNGRICDKWEFTKGGKLERTVWIDQKNHIPIKTVESNGMVIEFKNVREGAQAPDLFEIPAGYQKMDMGGMMGGQGMKPPQ